MSSASNKRLQADILELKKPLYSESGIFYEQTEADIRHGYGCVFGPQGSPYEDCPMLYEFQVGDSFPFDPPKVQFRTHDRATRFHPNMYKEGKVCLSILHTWEGPKWSSIMRLSTVLVTLQSLMDTNPILHEPGYTNLAPEAQNAYTKFVEHSCIRYILERAETLVQKREQPEAFKPFQDVFLERLPGILERLEKRLEKLQQEAPSVLSVAYSMSCTTQYKKFYERVVKLKGTDFSVYK